MTDNNERGVGIGEHRGDSGEPLEALVDNWTFNAAGFNDYAVSFSFKVGTNGWNRFFISDQDRDHPNLVIAQSRFSQPDQQNQWYFRAFSGMPISERVGEEERDEYFEELRETTTPEYTVEAGSLQQLVEAYVPKRLKGEVND